MANASVSGLCALSLFLPFLVGLIFGEVLARDKYKRALWPKVVFPILWVLSICGFVVTGVFADHYFHERRGGWTWFWIVGVLLIIVGLKAVNDDAKGKPQTKG